MLVGKGLLGVPRVRWRLVLLLMFGLGLLLLVVVGLKGGAGRLKAEEGKPG